MPATLLKGDSNKLFSYENKNTYFEEHLRTTASKSIDTNWHSWNLGL